ncbi:hypothetical protein QW180_07820 [Vibrio sinaloensis]|nr:hypothetical protein [Vibrio sinaloensis]
MANVQSLAGAQLLLVEDNEINQELATELLEGQQIHITIAENGQQAVDLYQTQEFDGIFNGLPNADYGRLRGNRIYSSSAW